jgi:hypothetical protein
LLTEVFAHRTFQVVLSQLNAKKITMKKYIPALALACAIYASRTNAQSSSPNNLWALGKYLGYSTANPLNFRINGVGLMRLTPGGFLGIGLNPGFRLDVNDNINVNPQLANFMDGYRVLGQRFLFMPGGTGLNNTFVGIAGDPGGFYGNDNTMVGFGSGGNMSNACTRSAHHSTCVGEYSGYELGGGFITCIGYKAGYKVGDGDFCTFVGASSGMNATCTALNAFFGGNSGMNLVSGNSNTFVGANSAFSANGGSLNTVLGVWSAQGLTSGSNNIVIGPFTGNSLVNYSNIILLGNNADVAPPLSGGPLTNSIAIGDNTVVRNSDQVILGNNLQNVGIGLSNDPTGPQNRLEIDYSVTGTDLTANTCTGTGFSGLRFRDLTSNSTPCNNPGTGYLTVNSSGDVILSKLPPSTGGCCIGNLCSAPGSNPLNNTWEVPMMNGVNYMFNETILGGGSEVGIGHPIGTCGNTLGGKFEVINTSTSHRFALAFRNTASIVGQNTVGVGGSASSTTDDAIGMRGQCQGAGPGTFKGAGVIGTSLVSSICRFNIGVGGEAMNGGFVSLGGGFEVNSLTSPINVGTAGTVGNTALSMVSLLPPGTNVGVFGFAPAGGSSFAGYFDGDVQVNGNVYPGAACTYDLGSLSQRWNTVYACNGTIQTSDERLKTNVKILDYGINDIMKLNPVSYFWKNDQGYGRKIGFIAQDIQKIIPEVVKEGTDGDKLMGVNYAELTSLLVKGMQDQQKMIADQQKQIDELRSMMMQNGNNAPTSNNLNTTLSDKDVVVLDQNMPNPFAEQTVITFNLPDNVTRAQMLFYNIEGKLINSVELTQRGKCQLTVFANDLSNGVYTYALVVDGKVTDAKKMQKQK